MRFPVIHQHDASDCGPAVLAMMAAYHGKRISLARLRELAGTNQQGTTLAGLICAAKNLGFDARGVRATPEAIEDIPLPTVAHWRENNRNHFVVVESVARTSVTIADPALGRRKLTKPDFHKHWTGVLLLLTETANLRNAVTAKSPTTRLCSLLLPHRRLFLDVLLAAVLMTILGLASSFFIQALVDYVFVLGRTPALNWLGLGMLLVLLARASFLALRTYLLAHLSQRIDADTVLGYHRHLLGLPLSFFSTRRTGEILSRMNDAIKIRVAASATTLAVIVDAILLFATSAVMLMLSWRVTIASVCLVPGIGVVVWMLNKPMQRHQRAAMEKAADIEAQVMETVEGIQTIRALRAERSVRVKMESRLAEMLDAAFRSQLLASHCATLTTLASGVSSLSVLWFGGRQVLAGSISVGRLMALNAMLGMFLGPLERLSSANQIIQDAIVASDRLGEVLELDSESKAERVSALDRAVVGAVEFRSVGFRAVHEFSMKVEPGECVGIVGPSGVGKTTVANLLGRFFEPTAGRILVDGIDSRDYTFACLRREIGFVPQDIVLFNASIAENIRLGRPGASPAEVFNAAVLARLSADCDRVVGERGLSLSGGERQRVALARAILQNPAVLVLDEPTSHLDSECEMAVEALLDRRRGNKTTIVISHRSLGFDRVVKMG